MLPLSEWVAKEKEKNSKTEKPVSSCRMKSGGRRVKIGRKKGRKKGRFSTFFLLFQV